MNTLVNNCYDHCAFFWIFTSFNITNIVVGNVHKLQPEKLGFEIIDKPALQEMTDDVKSAMVGVTHK